MGELINGRTPEDIKAAFKHCIEPVPYGCEVCPYNETCLEHAPEIDAIALIERLESERDEALAKVQKWISVEERMPEHGTDVLVLTAPGTLSLGKNCVVAEYIHPRMEKSGVFINFYAGYDDKNILAVTHWMPLPEPPKEGKSNEDD